LLLREHNGGVIAIGQASHAWISGQLARAWGNAHFGAVAPWEEVCLAAEQHDIGMSAWDLAPTRNPDTGLPHSFIEMPLAVHLRLWTEGPPRLLSQSRYAALLVSMHGRRLYERRDLSRLSNSAADAVRAFIETRREFEAELLASLDPDPELIARNSQLIWIWDYMSLALCLDWLPATVRKVPTEDEPVDLILRATDKPRRLALDPWPCAEQAVTVRCEGRGLTGTYRTDGALAEAFASAPWHTLSFELAPAGAGA
jgi:hypothetical protein